MKAFGSSRAPVEEVPSVPLVTISNLSTLHPNTYQIAKEVAAVPSSAGALLAAPTIVNYRNKT